MYGKKFSSKGKNGGLKVQTDLVKGGYKTNVGKIRAVQSTKTCVGHTDRLFTCCYILFLHSC